MGYVFPMGTFVLAESLTGIVVQEWGSTIYSFGLPCILDFPYLSTHPHPSVDRQVGAPSILEQWILIWIMLLVGGEECILVAQCPCESRPLGLYWEVHRQNLFNPKCPYRSWTDLTAIYKVSFEKSHKCFGNRYLFFSFFRTVIPVKRKRRRK